MRLATIKARFALSFTHNELIIELTYKLAAKYWSYQRSLPQSLLIYLHWIVCLFISLPLSMYLETLTHHELHRPPTFSSNLGNQSGG